MQQQKVLLTCSGIYIHSCSTYTRYYKVPTCTTYYYILLHGTGGTYLQTLLLDMITRCHDIGDVEHDVQEHDVVITSCGQILTTTISTTMYQYHYVTTWYYMVLHGTYGTTWYMYVCRYVVQYVTRCSSVRVHDLITSLMLLPLSIPTRCWCQYVVYVLA